MNSTFFIKSTILARNPITPTIESWFIPFDILLIVCITLTIIISTLFLIIMILDKTCHTVPMMLVANSCLAILVMSCTMLSLCIFTFENDFQQIQHEDSLCIFRSYMTYISFGLLNFSFLLQALYRYITVIYSTHLFWQSFRFQGTIIGLTWIFSFIYPTAFMFTGEIIYNVDNQICMLPLRFDFSVFYAVNCVYIIPVSLIMFIYLKLILYVKKMSKRATPINTLTRVKREFKMVQRLIILITVLITIGFPFTIFILISFFTTPPKYHFRIAYIFLNVPLQLVMMILFQFTDPLKASVMKRIKVRSNTIVPAVA